MDTRSRVQRSDLIHSQNVVFSFSLVSNSFLIFPFFNVSAAEVRCVTFYIQTHLNHHCRRRLWKKNVRSAFILLLFASVCFCFYMFVYYKGRKANNVITLLLDVERWKSWKKAPKNIVEISTLAWVCVSSYVAVVVGWIFFTFCTFPFYERLFWYFY